MTPHRFFVPPSAVGDGTVVFDQDQTRQIRQVLRLRRGDRVVALDGTSREFEVRLDVTDGTQAVGIIERTGVNVAEPPVRVTLYQGLLKGAKLELVLQKCTEVGVSRFVPMVTARSVPAEPADRRRRRYRAIVKEAAEQSRRGMVPDVGEPVAFTEAVRDAVGRGRVILLWEGETETGLWPSTPADCREIGLFVGPEGGFTPEEVVLARRLGVTVVTLGKRILRSETAAIVGAALVLASVGDDG